MLEAPQVSKEVDRNRNTDHIADIVVADQCQSEEYDENSVFSVFDQLLHTVHHKREPDHRVDPHGVVLLCDTVGHQRIHHREGNDADSVNACLGFVQIECRKSKYRTNRQIPELLQDDNIRRRIESLLLQQFLN